MVYTKQTRRVGRGRGRGGGRAAAVGLGPRGGVGGRDHATSSRTSRRSRSSRSGPRDIASAPIVESSQPMPAEDSSYDPTEETHEEYTPRTPTREDLQENIVTLEGENAELRTELSRVRAEKDEAREWLNNLQGEHVKQGEELNKVLTEYDELFEINHTLAWKCKEIEWEKRILARSLKRRLGDRARYYRGVVTEYVGLIKGYFSSWANQYHHGPNLGIIWNYRPENNYEEFVRVMHYPMDMP